MTDKTQYLSTQLDFSDFEKGVVRHRMYWRVDSMTNDEIEAWLKVIPQLMPTHTPKGQVFVGRQWRRVAGSPHLVQVTLTFEVNG